MSAAIENLVAFLAECDTCCRDAVFCSNAGEQVCEEHMMAAITDEDTARLLIRAISESLEQGRVHVDKDGRRLTTVKEVLEVLVEGGWVGVGPDE